MTTTLPNDRAVQTRQGGHCPPIEFFSFFKKMSKLQGLALPTATNVFQGMRVFRQGKQIPELR